MKKLIGLIVINFLVHNTTLLSSDLEGTQEPPEARMRKMATLLTKESDPGYSSEEEIKSAINQIEQALLENPGPITIELAFKNLETLEKRTTEENFKHLFNAELISALSRTYSKASAAQLKSAAEMLGEALFDSIDKHAKTFSKAKNHSFASRIRTTIDIIKSNLGLKKSIKQQAAEFAENKTTQLFENVAEYKEIGSLLTELQKLKNQDALERATEELFKEKQNYKALKDVTEKLLPYIKGNKELVTQVEKAFFDKMHINNKNELEKRKQQEEEINNLKEQIKQLEQEKSDLNLQIEDAQIQNEKLQNALLELAQQKAEIESAQKKVQSPKKILDLTDEARNLKTPIIDPELVYTNKSLANQIEELKIVHQQKLAEQRKQHIQAQQEQAKQYIQTINNTKDQYQKEVLKLQKAHEQKTKLSEEEYAQEIEYADKQVNQAEQQKLAAERRVQEVAAQLKQERALRQKAELDAQMAQQRLEEHRTKQEAEHGGSGDISQAGLKGNEIHTSKGRV